MPQLKINVNGQKFVISGMSRSACSKQLLCALAKVNPQVEYGSSTSEGCSTAAIHTNSACSNQSTTVGSKDQVEKCEDIIQTLLILGKEKIKKRDDKRGEKVSTKRFSKKQKEAPRLGNDNPLRAGTDCVETNAKQERLKRSKNPAKDNFVDDKLEKSSASKLKNGNYFKKFGETGKLKRALFTGVSREYLTDLVNAQKKCLKTQHRRIKEKEKTITRYSKRLLPAKEDDIEALIKKTGSDKNKETADDFKRDDKAKDTDHDTGISEQHSSDMDGSCETQTPTTNRAVNAVPEVHWLDKNGAMESIKTKYVKELSCASADSQICSIACVREDEPTASKSLPDTISTPDPMFHRSAGSRSQACADEKNSGVDIVIDSNGTLVETLESRQITANGSNHDTQLEKEVGKIRVEIKTLQSQLEKQNRLINLLTNLAEQNKIDEHESDKEDWRDMEKQVRSLQSSIALSVELYDYQKSEMDANATALRHAETEIRRKRWHVDSLRKHLDSLTMCTHSNKGKERRPTGKYYRLASTLV